MTWDDDIEFDGHDQPPFRIDFGEWEPREPEPPDWSSCGDYGAFQKLLGITPRPRSLGSFAGNFPDPLSLDEFERRIPWELQKYQNWCVWMFEYDPDNDRWKKPPYVPFPGRRIGFYPASATKSQNWVAFAAAYAAAIGDPDALVEGLGRFFSADDPFVGIDLDDCFDEDGNLHPWAAEILAMFPGAYVEYSPSGRGLKLWTRGKLPGRGIKVTGLGPDGQGAIEVYDRERYFTVTAHPYGPTVRVIADGSAAVLALYERLGGGVGGKAGAAVQGGPRVALRRPGVAAPGSAVLTDDQVIAKARAAYPEFGRLFDSGDLSGHANDWSRADAALLKQIAYFARGDRDQIERVFGMSALAQREKWADRPDYRERTIDAVLAGMTKFFDPAFRSQARRSASGGSSQWVVVS